jgi:hypothetical protein
MRRLSRIEPIGPPQAYQTHTLAQPLATHWQRVRCENAIGGCRWHEEGFSVQCDTADPTGLARARWIENHSGRRWTREYTGDLIVYRFAAGQQCFSEHRAPKGYDPIARRRVGDDRGTDPRARVITFKTPEHWRDDFGEHLLYVAERRSRG